MTQQEEKLIELMIKSAVNDGMREFALKVNENIKIAVETHSTACPYGRMLDINKARLAGVIVGAGIAGGTVSQLLRIVFQ